jgi:hypothetical protein
MTHKSRVELALELAGVNPVNCKNEHSEAVRALANKFDSSQQRTISVALSNVLLRLVALDEQAAAQRVAELERRISNLEATRAVEFIVGDGSDWGPGMQTVVVEPASPPSEDKPALPLAIRLSRACSELEESRQVAANLRKCLDEMVQVHHEERDEAQAELTRVREENARLEEWRKEQQATQIKLEENLRQPAAKTAAERDRYRFKYHAARREVRRLNAALRVGHLLMKKEKVDRGEYGELIRHNLDIQEKRANDYRDKLAEAERTIAGLKEQHQGNLDSMQAGALRAHQLLLKQSAVVEVARRVAEYLNPNGAYGRELALALSSLDQQSQPEPPSERASTAETYAAWRNRPAIDWELCTCPKGKPSSPTRPGSAIVIGHGPHCAYIAARCDRDAALIANHKSAGGSVDWSGEPIAPSDPATSPEAAEPEPEPEP